MAYAGPALAADAAYRWTVEARGPGARWGPASAPARFTTALRDGDWQAQWLRPAGDSQQPDRVTYLRTEVTPPAGAVDRVDRLRLRRAHLPAVRGRRAGGRLAQLLLPRRAVRAGGRPDRHGGRRAAQRHRRAAPLVRAGAGAPRLLPRPAVPALGLVRRRPPGRLRVGRHVARTPGRVAALAAAQQRRRRLRRMGGRPGPAPGVVEPRLRRRRLVAGDGRRPRRHRALQPDLRAADHHRRDARPPGPPGHPGRWRRRGGLRRRLRGAAAGGVHPGAAGAHRRRCGPATCSIPTARSRRCTGRRRRTSRPPTSCGRAARPSRPSPTSGSATCRSTTRASP